MASEEASTRTSLKDRFKETDGGRQRFLLELEFVHCLANPTYINYLAQNRYFEDESFVGYLKYLEYWQLPEYSKFIVYPHALFFLELLQNPHFRSAMSHPANKELAHRQQFYYWKHHRSNRLKNILPRQLSAEENVPASNSAVAAAVAPPPPPPQLPTQAPPTSFTPVAVKTESDVRPPGIDRRKRKFQPP
ncbi:hypothetical protein KP509_38G014900 [Ceratopteris richardii]|uniref:Mediator of RNA polymerase II transcription subunit 31 n=1 Tax=Ceratopteris richardii TaxID=49495 RepID=A0A8T2Q2P2_CERRI|nr:hypothetical protein KP509_38G014900 [Ceratopteris richardii]